MQDILPGSPDDCKLSWRDEPQQLVHESCLDHGVAVLEHAVALDPGIHLNDACLQLLQLLSDGPPLRMHMYMSLSNASSLQEIYHCIGSLRKTC